MDRRKRILVNKYEEATDVVLREVASKNNARVHAKVRVADVLDIRTNELTPEEYSYALKAHFDFVVEREGDVPAFAVEFDGSNHYQDSSTIHRDKLKNTICKKLEMPLLRIDASYLRSIGSFSTLLSWLVEIWFLHEDFCQAQEQGELNWDEVWHYSFYLGSGYFEGDNFVSIDETNIEDLFKEKNGKRIILTSPYDPFQPSRIKIVRWYNKGIVTRPNAEILHADNNQGYCVAVAFVKMSNGKIIIGEARCRSQSFPPIGPDELARELVVLDVAEKMQKYLNGKCKPATDSQVELWRKQIARWKSESKDL